MELRSRLRSQWTKYAQEDRDGSGRPHGDARLVDAGRAGRRVGQDGDRHRLRRGPVLPAAVRSGGGSDRHRLDGGTDRTARALGSKGEVYLVGDAEMFDGVCDDGFDLAVSYIVLTDLFDYRRSIREAYRVLRPGGRFIVCNIHPMRSAAMNTDGWISDRSRKLFYPVDNYTEEGPREFLWWRGPIINMHRTVVELCVRLPQRRVRAGRTP